jgi:oligopeptide/dipeptide ABC transporter ATP-binding protein
VIPPLLELRHVTKVFQSGLRRTAASTTVALRDASLVVPSGYSTATAVAGESGSGKTTMARLLLGFIRPTSGQILYKGVDLARMTRAQHREYRREVQPIFQDPFEVYNPFYRVDHVLTTPLRNFGLYRGRGEAQRRIEEALEMVGLRPRETLGRYPHELSGGQRQRIMVARALLLRPRIIMADEPVSMVDASLRATILDELRKLNTEFGISLLYITHDLTTAYQICDDIVVLYQGSVAEVGSVERVIRDPQHPYTRLLVSSIPLPDRSRRWGDDDLQVPESSAGRTTDGCRFAPRCPHAMEECWARVPPLFRVDSDRAAACLLHRDAPELASRDVGQVLRAPPDAPAA